MKNKIFSVNIIVSLIIIMGFVLAGISTYLSFQTLFNKDIESVSELTSESIYDNINNLMDRPINVSLTMAHDTFLRDFISKESVEGLQGSSLQTMKDYLSSYKKKYAFDSVFFVSTKTGAYYHYRNGLDRVMTPDNLENTWYYDFLKEKAECSLNVDNDEASDNVVTIFVNCKLYDENNNVLGIVGVGLKTPYIQQFLVDKEKEYGIHAYLIDASGNIQISSQLTEFENVNLFDEGAFSDMADAITLSKTATDKQWYHSNKADGYIITKYVPNLNWYLVVEKNTVDFTKKMNKQLVLDIAFLLIVVLIIVHIINGIIKKYNYKLTNLAERDQLTGIGNRTSYEKEISRYSDKLDTYQNFGIGVFDLNNLKVTNDLYGHQAGDQYLKSFAKKLCNTFDHCPVFRIGGDEFAIIFLDLSAKSVLDHWNKLLQEIEIEKNSGGLSISAAFGYAFWDPQNLNTVEKIFKAADDKMYQSKENLKQNN